MGEGSAPWPQGTGGSRGTALRGEGSEEYLNQRYTASQSHDGGQRVQLKLSRVCSTCLWVQDLRREVGRRSSWRKVFIAVGDEGGQGVHVSMLDHWDLIRLKARTRQDQVQTLYKEMKSKQTLFISIVCKSKDYYCLHIGLVS